MDMSEAIRIAREEPSDETFVAAVAGALEAGLEPIVLANALGLSCTTILRWRDGLSLPHPIMREPVLVVIERLTGRCLG